jgi:hypothetical protein
MDYTFYYNAVEFVETYWLALIFACFAGSVFGAYMLGRQHGSPIITAIIPSETRKEVTEELAVIDLEVSTTINQQAAVIMGLSTIVDSLQGISEKYEESERLRKKWHRMYRCNTNILKSLISSPWIPLPRTWRLFKENLPTELLHKELLESEKRRAERNYYEKNRTQSMKSVAAKRMTK